MLVSEVMTQAVVTADSRDSLRHVGELTGLQTLSLADTEITDAGLEHLQGLSNLEVLYLTYTQVTDVGVELLKALKNLQTLALARTKVTNEGVKEMKQALPNAHIHLRSSWIG